MEIRLKDKIYLPNRVYKKIDLSASFFAASLSPFFSISRALHCATYKYIPSLQYNRENKLPRLIKRERESDTLEPVTLDLLHARALSSTIAFIYTYILYSYDGASASARIIEIARARESTRREEAAAAWKEGAREKKREKQQQRRQLLRQGERGMSLGAAAAAAGDAADVKTTFFARARERERKRRGDIQYAAAAGAHVNLSKFVPNRFMPDAATMRTHRANTRTALQRLVFFGPHTYTHKSE